MKLIKAKKFINTSALGFNINKNVFINHHMMSDTHELFKKTMILKRERKLEAVNPKTNFISVKIRGNWRAVRNFMELEDLIKE